MPCEIETTKRFRKCVHGQEEDVLQALRRVVDGFGNPHLHGGLSIRKLAPGLFECRTDLKLRLVFRAKKGLLTFDFAGNHDEVRSYLKEQR